MTQETEVQGLTYEQAIAELDGLISQLERGDVPLADAIRCYERGALLAAHCAGLLDATEQAVMQVVVGPGGREEERPLAALPAADVAPAPPAGGTAEPAPSAAATARRTAAPPPPSAPRPRAVATPAPALFPGMEPPPAAPGSDDPGFDLDDIPF